MICANLQRSSFPAHTQADVKDEHAGGQHCQVPSRSTLSSRSIFRIAQHCSLCVEACLKGCEQAAAFIGEAKDLEGGLKLAQDSFCHGTNIFIFWNWHMAVGDAELWALFRPMLLLQSTET